MPDAFSLYPQPPAPQQNNLLANPTAVLDMAAKVNQLQQFDRDFKAQNAIGEIYRKNIRPDGTINEHGVIRDISQNPLTASKAPEAAAGALQREGQRLQNAGAAITNQTAQFEQQQKMHNAVVESFNMIDPDKPTPEQVYRWGVHMKSVFPNVPSAIISSSMQTAMSDPNGLAHGVASLKNMMLGSQGTSARVAGPPGAGGAPQTITAAQANLATAGGGAPTGIPTALPPGVGEAKQTAGAAGGTMLANDRLRGADYQQHVFPLEKAIPALERLGKEGTGPGKEEINNIKSFLQSAGIPGLDANKIKDFDEAKKYLTDFVNQNGNSGTNDKLAAAFAGSPSTKISNAAAVDVAKSALALRRMQQAKLIAFEQSGRPEDEYGKWAATYSTNTDPRAFGFDMMTPDQRKKVIESIPKNKRERFMMDVQAADDAGLLNGGK